ncbi:metallo-mystery pair system four-Cys motif protein [Myxococcus sp. K15C18031901]|uniref:MbnP family copper-binding protein n=1 Tax=Myxococcus dinghuensis TaxID=2906761 RepID=UPI0020A77BD7|nr:MbnP family copper-binding protein [Myxococcus dinghuensis]MCP3104769.1 metallo-mystery pair system four-Cys motif protein [Myxococcus dinghuensis]
MNAVWKSASLLVPCALLSLGCGGEDGGDEVATKTYTVRFSPQVRGEALLCGTSYPDIGTSRGVIELVDFKMFVRDVTLIRANGERQALKLEQGTHQLESLALLDFEDATGLCRGGNAATRREVVGTAPAHDDYTRLEFKLGVPPEVNHLDAELAAPPLSNTSMWWTWQTGYKFLKLDLRSQENETFFFHLGAVGCTGSVGSGYSCTTESQTTITLTDFDPEQSQVVLDVAGLLSQTDVNRVPDGRTDMMPGCMSSASDPECPALFSQVGLSVDGSPLTVPTTFFRVR